MDTFLDQAYWDERYLNNTAAWDIGSISMPLKTYIDQLPDKNIAILIPGCGNAYEAAYLLENGFTNVSLIDISPAVVKVVREKLKKYHGQGLQIICGDFFELDQSFDLILEQTFFCALEPVLREKYVTTMQRLLFPAGKLAGVLFNKSFMGGPPFSGNKEEYVRLFSKEFEIKKMEACYNSILPRKDSELFIELLPLQK